VCDRFVARQDAADAEEAGLHDRVDAAAHSDLPGERIRVDREETKLLLDDLLLHLARKSIPNSAAITRRVQEKDGTVCRVLEHVDLVDEFELVTGYKASAVDEVS